MKQRLLKKFELLLVILAYVALIIFFIMVVYVAINYVKGKRFDWDTKSWISKGMIIFASRPSGGNLYINGNLTRYRTGSSMFPRKLNIFAPGNYEVKVTKDGYRNWVKNFEVKESSLHWAYYIWLIRENIDYNHFFDDLIVNNVFQYRESSMVILAVNEDDIADRRYYLADLNDKRKKIPLPFNENEKIKDLIWSNSGNKLLAMVTDSHEKTSYIVLQGNNLQEIINITDIFKIDFEGTDISWSNSNENELYFLKESRLFRLDFENKFITAPLINNVLSYSLVDRDKLLVAKSDDQTKEVNLWQIDENGNNKKLLFSALPFSENYKIKCTQNCEKISVLSEKNGNLKVISKIKGKLHSQQLAENIDFAKWSGDGKKILYGDNSKIFVFDYEKELEYLVFEGKNFIAEWYPDSYHIIINTNEKGFVINYDGYNKILLTEKMTSPLFFVFDFSNFYYLADNKLINFRVD